MQSMMLNSRSEAVKKQIKQGNVDLGFRMIVDLALDTKDAKAFQYVINHMQWQDEHLSDIDLINQKCLELIDKLETFPVIKTSEDEVLLNAQGIIKDFGSRKFSLGPIDLTIRAGDLFGLVGENGNGKTTLLRMLARDLELSSGSIDYPYIKGKESLYDIRTQLIYIPQRTPTWYGLVKDNLKFAAAHYGVAPKDNEATVLLMMIRFGLWKYRNYKWSELSSGYKMRFELARTFLRKPKLLLIDEPLSNLDIVSQKLIVEDLMMLGKSLVNPLGIVLSSQQLYEIEKISTDVIFLKNGTPTNMGYKASDGDSLIIEIEIDQDQHILKDALKSLNVTDINFNGGSYLVEINHCNVSQILMALANANIDVRYFRNVTNSTRRFF